MKELVGKASHFYTGMRKGTIVFSLSFICFWQAHGQVQLYEQVQVPYGLAPVQQDTLEPENPSSVPMANDQQTTPRYYRNIIKANAVSREGLFNIHQVDDKYYFEIPDTLLGRDILVVSRISRGAAGIRPGHAGYAGDQIGTSVIRFEKGPSHNLFLRRVSFADNIGDSTNSMFNAVIRSNLQPLAASFGISAYTTNGQSSVVDVTEYINGDNDILFFSPGTKQSMRIGSMLSNMCYIKDVQPFPLNIEIRTIKTYQTEASVGSTFTWEINTSLVLLPKKPMHKRVADRRIGYFSERYTDYDANPQGVEVVSYIKRWRLEPKPEDVERYKQGELVEPAKPIIFYIDPATPKKWVPYLIQGVNDWQVAFWKAGFKNAIIAKEAPNEKENPDWRLEDARHSAIVYKPSSFANATGPIITDPRSGEILESHINWYHNLMSILQTWYMVQCGVNDPKGQKMHLEDDLMGRLIRSVASHEVGHALGLMHNFGASSSVPVEKLRDKEWVEGNGFCPSIMDYARFNFVAQPEDSIGIKGLISRIGEYDIWAIEWGYRWFPDLSAEEEKNTLNKWAIERLKDPGLRFGSELSPDDPRSQTEDLGDNAMVAGEYGIKNLQRTVPHLLEWTKEENEGYHSLSETYIAVTRQFENYIGHVLKNIGGVYETFKTSDQPGAVYEPVPAQLQKDAVNFLDKHVFQAPVWLLDTAILARTGMTPAQIIGTPQEMVLSELLNVHTLNDLLNAQTMYGLESYNLMEYLKDLDQLVWKELKNYAPIDIYRRMLQRSYTEKLINLVNTNKNGKTYGDIIAIVKEQLRNLQTRIKPAIRKTDDPMSKYHLQHLLEQIDAAVM